MPSICSWWNNCLLTSNDNKCTVYKLMLTYLKNGSWIHPNSKYSLGLFCWLGTWSNENKRHCRELVFWIDCWEEPSCCCRGFSLTFRIAEYLFWLCCDQTDSDLLSIWWPAGCYSQIWPFLSSYKILSTFFEPDY